MNCKIVGYEFKTLEVTLQPNETFYAERGSLVWVDAALQRDVEMNGGNQNGSIGNMLGGMLKSALSGESVLILRFYNPTSKPLKMVLSGSCCALLPIKLQGENLICRRGHYVTSTNKISLNLNLNIQGILGGIGLFQKVEGNATVFLDSNGSPIIKEVAPGESIEMDENNIIAFHGFQPQQIQAGWSFGNMIRGEGLSLMRVTGPGKVYLSPLAFVYLSSTNNKRNFI